MFTIYSRLIGDVEPFEHLEGAEGLTLGQAVKLAGGSLAKCGPTEKPTYMIVGVRTGEGKYPAIRVLPTTIFQTTASATLAQNALGAPVTLNATADGVTATTEGGVFTPTFTDGETGGGVVRGYFA